MFLQLLSKLKNETKMKSSLRARGPPGVSGTLRSLRILRIGRIGSATSPFNLGSNAGSTHTSISQTQPLDMTLSMCTQLLWSTMARPFLSGICPVKPLDGLGHRAAAQFQVLGNLLIAFAIFWATIRFFRSSEFFAMLNFRWPVWESESNNTKFNTPAPHSHLRPCNTKSHMTPGRENG